jgi:dynein heavy chain
MVYFEPHTMGLYPSLASWINTLPETMTEANKLMIESLFKWLVPPCIKLIRKELKEICPTSDIQLAWSLFKMFSAQLAAFKVDAKKFVLTEKEVVVHIECIFLVSMTWSVCCSVDRAGRERFDNFLRECVAGTVPPPYSEEGERGSLNIGNPFPKEGSIYSYYFDASKAKWSQWSNLISKEPLSENLEPHEIIVPTIDTARFEMNSLAEANFQA